VYPQTPGPVDAIRTYSERLVDARLLDVHDLRSHAVWADAVILQYNPFSYGRRGFAPALIQRWAAVRATARAVMVHEPFVPMIDWRSTLMGAWQRAQLAAVTLLAQRVFISVEGWRPRLPVGRRAGAVHLPVGSTLPDARARRLQLRAEVGAGPGTFVIATLSTGHASHLVDLVDLATRAIAAEREVLVLNLGAGARSLSALPVRVVEPGRLDAERLASHMAAADLFLSPLVDGISTRRSSLMNALQQGIPVVGTDGELTDSVFRDRAYAGWRLAPASDANAFAAASLEVSRRPEELKAMGHAARRAYEECFDWPRAAERLVQALAA
jgi:glycosyltransferase involved in cell wall biosynthesis